MESHPFLFYPSCSQSHFVDTDPSGSKAWLMINFPRIHSLPSKIVLSKSHSINTRSLLKQAESFHHFN